MGPRIVRKTTLKSYTFYIVLMSGVFFDFVSIWDAKMANAGLQATISHLVGNMRKV